MHTAFSKLDIARYIFLIWFVMVTNTYSVYLYPVTLINVLRFYLAESALLCIVYLKIDI